MFKIRKFASKGDSMRPESEREASSSTGENISLREASISTGKYTSLPNRNDSTEAVGPKQEYEESLGEHSTQKSNGQNDMSDLGLPSSFSPHRRTGGKETFECTLCNVILTCVAMKDRVAEVARPRDRRSALAQGL